MTGSQKQQLLQRQDGISPDGSLGEFPLLDPQETSVPCDNPSGYRAFLTSGMLPDINFNRMVYETIDDRDGKHRSATFNGCRTSAWFVRHRVSGRVRVASSRCRLRWCPLCIRTKRYIIVNSVIPWAKNVKKPKFITLTLKHSTAPLSHQIKSLYDYFRVLRRRPAWKRRIKGGIWFFQVKKSEQDGLWHPHLHMLSSGHYLSRDDLSRLWLDVTGSSKIVDITGVKNIKETAKYVSRYATSPCRLSDLCLEDAVEVVDAMHGRRICGTWGTAKGIDLNPPACENPDDWEVLESFHIVMKSRNGSDWSRLIYEAWIKDDFCYAVPDPPKQKPAEFEFAIAETPSSYKQFVFEWSA